jgi:nicotinate phosphoribosyltransferase
MTELEKKEAGLIQRLGQETFRFDPSIASGFFSANYFLKTRYIVKNYLANQQVLMQFFQWKDDLMVCGVDEALTLIETFANQPDQLIIHAMHDGQIVQSKQPVLTIQGRYEDFGFLESVIDGILSRRSSVATNSKDVLIAAGNKVVFSMADRQDDYHTQPGDGYASYVAGIRRFSTDAQAHYIGGKGMGTMPHALIQMCEGDIVKAAGLYHQAFPQEKITALVDYHNDVIVDALRVAKAFPDLLGAVRVDTSMSLVDEFFKRNPHISGDINGVNPQLIKALRLALNENGFQDVKIIVSSGFNPEKISYFEQENTPVDMYGVGLYLTTIRTNFSADLVELNGVHQAKVGRKRLLNPLLEKVNFQAS